ncbi:MAG: hypothetical protein JNL21_41635 [Myxococcales bacterium]|nr:hypothetical protein [Myxococcales bacterium]
MTDLEGAEMQRGERGRPSEGEAFRRLDDILRALPKSELDGLIRRIGIKVDPQKRIDVPSQVARALVGQTDVRDPSRLPVACQLLLRKLAEAGGVLHVPTLPPGFEPLMARGILFIRRTATGYELVVPAAYLVQLPTWPSEDPRSMRALLAQAPFETVSAVASHYLGRPATPPIALALEAAWEVVSDPAQLAQEISALPLLERRLLEAIDNEGGEVETTELLDLEREPMRLRNAKGVTTTRRGAGFALERRALLIPIHPNRHVIPTEVATIVGAERRQQQESRRADIRSQVLGEDHLPRRASFARDPAGIALAIAIAAREAQAEIRPNVGTPRSLIVRLAQRFGRAPDAVWLIAALSRGVGLWEPTAISTASPPGSMPVGHVASSLFAAWRAGGSWDEARPEPEMLRASPDQREPSPMRGLRELVLDGLLELGEEGWILYGSFERYVLSDPRIAGLERLLRRWAERLGLEPPPLGQVVRRIVLETLPVLGVVDLGHDSRMSMVAVSDESDAGAEVQRTALRLTQRGRALIHDKYVTTPRPSEFLDSHVLRVGTGALVGHVVALGPLAETGRVEDTIDLVLSPTAIARAIESGAGGEEIRERIEAVASLPGSLSQILERASVVVGKASLVPAVAFLWVDDPDVRELLRTRKTTADLFVDPSPPGGLLVATGVDFERLVRRCRGVGVEVEGASPDVSLRARAMTPRPSPVVEPPSRSGTRTAPTSRTPVPRSRTPFPRTK